jgi:DNA-binding NarL/FixJ family response regulator
VREYDASRADELSPREQAITKKLLEGPTASEIANELGISFHTVRTHIRNIYIKTGVANRIELMRWSMNPMEAK